jgi:hypothetical protein
MAEKTVNLEKVDMGQHMIKDHHFTNPGYCR